MPPPTENPAAIGVPHILGLTPSPEEFGALLRVHGPAARRLVQRLLADPADVEEVLQEAWLQVFTHLHTYAQRAEIGTWIHAVVRNAALMRLRHKNRRPEDAVPRTRDSADDAQTWSSLVEERPDAWLEARELAMELGRALSELDAPSRDIWVLKNLEGYSLDEISEATDMSLAAVKSRLHRTRERLRNELDPWHNV